MCMYVYAFVCAVGGASMGPSAQQQQGSVAREEAAAAARALGFASADDLEASIALQVWEWGWEWGRKCRWI
jgi:hypothetical protein